MLINPRGALGPPSFENHFREPGFRFEPLRQIIEGQGSARTPCSHDSCPWFLTCSSTGTWGRWLSATRQGTGADWTEAASKEARAAPQSPPLALVAEEAASRSRGDWAECVPVGDTQREWDTHLNAPAHPGPCVIAVAQPVLTNTHPAVPTAGSQLRERI